MKKIFNKISLLLCAVLLLAGCSCSKNNDNSIKANISDGDATLVTGAKDGAKTYSLQNVYDSLKATSANELAADKLVEIIGDLVLFTNDAEGETWKGRYDAKIKEKLKALIDNDSYKLNGKFNEELLKITLNSQLYSVTCTVGEDLTPGEGLEKLTCDYSDYIQKALRVETIEELLKEKYIYDEVLEEKENLFSTKKVRLVEYLTIDSTNEDALDFIHEWVGRLSEENSTVTLEKIAEEWEKKLIADLDEQKDSIGKNKDANGSIMKDFTNGYKYSVKEGYDIKKEAIENTSYFESTIITSDKKDILNSALVSRILSDNIVVETGTTNKSYEINGNHYVVNPLADANINERDIVIKDTTNNKYYLIRVEVVTKTSEHEYEGVKVMAQNNTLVADYLNYYLEQNKDSISVHDQEVYEYLKTIYPTIFAD